MKVSSNKVVQLHYELRLDTHDGEFVEKTDAQSPLTFIAGIGMMLPEFENKLEGKGASDEFAFLLEADDAYGTFDAEAIVEIPTSAFDGNEDMIALGNVIPMRGPDDDVLYGRITEVHDTHVLMDFNHPMAGKNLYFTGSIVSVREATPEEIAHGHVHGDGGVHHD
jgi:FKBP-type peptidyl-prolyl cis-trans isomerase SlyD